MRRKRCCPSPINGKHLLSCPSKNLKVDFSDLLKVINDLENQSRKKSARRSPKRISAILKRIKVIWKTYPELRLLQLLLNPLGGEDPYYIEDDEWLKKAKEFYKQKKQKN